MLTSAAVNPDLQLALTLADRADEITMRYFRADFAVRTKADRTPVTEVDEAVEQMIVDHLWQERPHDGILGEELGARGGASRRWIIDPIDATKNFIRGIPIFATLIALENEIGVVSAPALGRRWWASRGAGAFCNGAAIRVSSIDDFGAAQIGYDDIGGFKERSEKFLALQGRCGRARGFGDFWTHMLVAEGAIEIAVEPEVAHWDMAAVQVIVEEAGGRFTSLGGEARADGGSGLSTNALLHEAVLEALR
ncbi:MAG TPA: inositol monophosphatase family protein [Thermoanaerobaculia bacterium]|nr:inositol monophosphatase family protein [Thermoanaerobaculia bacterium]